MTFQSATSAAASTASTRGDVDIEVGQVWQSKADSRKRVQVLGFGRPPLDGADRAEVEDVRTYRRGWIRTVGWVNGPVRLAGYELVDKCELCSGPRAENHSACCSSHGKVLCCTCYRRSHFVESECCPKVAAIASEAPA